jgi:RNA polymerase sigma-70 factor (ECF subfamily)
MLTSALSLRPFARRGALTSCPDPDADVLELVDAGDMKTAAAHLMRRHGTEVYRYCRIGLHDAQIADDVHQQVFIDVLRALSSFQRRSTLRAWLFAIARNRMLDAAKARRRAKARVVEADPGDPPDPRPGPGAVIDDLRLEQALVECLAQLDEPSRTAVVLRYQQGFTFEEMAAICNEKPGTLAARVSRALPRLRALIEARFRRVG